MTCSFDENAGPQSVSNEFEEETYNFLRIVSSLNKWSVFISE